MSEILGALFKTIAALIAVGAAAIVFYAVSSGNKAQDAISDQTQFAGAVSGLFNGQNDFTSLTTAVGVKIAPKSMVSGTTLKNPWGGSITPAVNASNSAQWQLTQTTVPVEACIKMIGSITSIVGLSVNGTAQTFPLDAGTGALACNADSNTLLFTYGR